MINEAIAYLNAAGQQDPDAIRALLSARILINRELAADPRLEAHAAAGGGMRTPRADSGYRTTPLDLIAAMLSAATKADAPIVLRMRENNGCPEVYIEEAPERLTE